MVSLPVFGIFRVWTDVGACVAQGVCTHTIGESVLNADSGSKCARELNLCLQHAGPQLNYIPTSEAINSLHLQQYKWCNNSNNQYHDNMVTSMMTTQGTITPSTIVLFVIIIIIIKITLIIMISVLSDISKDKVWQYHRARRRTTECKNNDMIQFNSITLCPFS